MTPEALEIVDTAVKIGLGALISGVATFSITTLNHRNDINKDSRVRRRQLIERVAEDVESFCNASLEYWAYLTDFTRRKENNYSIPDSVRNNVISAGERLFDEYANLTSAESKLLLLGLDNCESTVRDLGDCVKRLRSTPWREKSTLTYNEVESYRADILAKRKAFFSELKVPYQT